MNKKEFILVTGAAGFIGAALIKNCYLLEKIIGIDNLNDYYDINLKKQGLKIFLVIMMIILENGFLEKYINDFDNLIDM